MRPAETFRALAVRALVATAVSVIPLGAGAQANPTQERGTFTDVADYYDSCLQEDARVTSDIAYTIQTTVSSSGKRMQKITWQNDIVVTGLTTGRVMRGRDIENIIDTSNEGTTQGIYHYSLQMLLIGRGGVPNELSTFSYGIVIDANGRITRVFPEQGTFRCSH